MSSFQNNIYYLYIIKLSKWLMLIMPIVALYYAENGLSDFDIFLLQAIYSCSVALLEIPSGYLADVVGRKKTLLTGAILGTIGFVIYSVSHSFWGFVLAEIILGLGGSCISGSDSALLYDTLVVLKKEQHYLQFEGRITSLGNFAETVAAICGGIIAVLLSYRMVYVSQAIIAAIAIPASLLLVEPPRKRLQSRPSVQQIVKVCHHALVRDKTLSATLLYSSVIGTATLCMAWTSQVYFVRNGMTEVAITPIWVVLNLTTATVAAYAAKVVDSLGRKRAHALIVFLIPFGYFFLGAFSLVPAIFSLILFYAVRGYATPFLKDLINNFCGSEVRATILSIRSLIIRFSFTILGPLLGLLSGVISLSFALMCMGGIFLILSLVSAAFMKRSLPVNYWDETT